MFLQPLPCQMMVAPWLQSRLHFVSRVPLQSILWTVTLSQTLRPVCVDLDAHVLHSLRARLLLAAWFAIGGFINLWLLMGSNWL
jgi:hypothetical protein